MFGLITKGFIEKVHSAFDELEYHVNYGLSYNDFCEKAIYALNHTKDLEDAINVVRMFHFCSSEWDKIEKIFSDHLSQWSEYSWEGSSFISYCREDEANGEYYITNGITKDYKKIFLSSVYFDLDLIPFTYDGGRFMLGNNSDYYVKYSRMSSTKMKLFDQYDQCIANIVLSDNMDIFLENNKTPFEIVIQDGFIEVYDRDYYDSLDEYDYFDREQVIADIEWDILEKNSDLGVAKLSLYEEVGEYIDLLLLFAASTFLLFKSYMGLVRASNSLTTAAIVNNAWRRR